MKKWFFGEKKHLDQEKIEQEREDCKNLRWLLDNGTGDEFETYLRGNRPDATEKEIQELLRAFYQRRTERQQELRNARALRRRP
jgi:hypothetical protein